MQLQWFSDGKASVCHGNRFLTHIYKEIAGRTRACVCYKAKKHTHTHTHTWSWALSSDFCCVSLEHFFILTQTFQHFSIIIIFWRHASVDQQVALWACVCFLDRTFQLILSFSIRSAFLEKKYTYGRHSYMFGPFPPFLCLLLAFR